MKKVFRLSLLILTLSFLMSCRTTGTAGESANPVFLTDRNSISLLPTGLYRDSREVLQMIEGRYGNTKYVMQAVLLLSPERISVSAFSPLGNSVYSLDYADGKATYEAAVSVPSAGALYLVADIQLCYYPEADVKRMIEEAGLDFHVEEKSDGWVRTISIKDKPLIRITRKGNKLEYINLKRNYEYTIEESGK